MSNSDLGDQPVEVSSLLEEKTRRVLCAPSVEGVNQLRVEKSDVLLVDWISEQQNSVLETVSSSCDAKEVSPLSVAQEKEHSEKSRKKRRRDAQHFPDTAMDAFRQSQRILRKEGKAISMKEVFSKTLFLSSPELFSFPEESVPSVASPTLSLSSPWSPQVANDITSQFLSTMEAKKKKKFERLVSSTSSKSSWGNFTPPNTDTFLHSEEELIIGDEDANMLPPFCSDDPLLQQEEPSLIGSLAATDDLSQQNAAVREKNQEKEELFEKERIAALSRKHRIWELQKQKRGTLNALETLSNISSENSLPTPSLVFSGTKTTGFTHSTHEAPEYFSTIAPLHRIRCASDLSVGESNLSHDDISMIKRINSFDKTAAKQMVVFTSASEQSK